MPTGFMLYCVRGDSMSPALRHGDCALARRTNGLARAPERGTLAVIAAPGVGEGRQIKRIVGLPGERIRFEDGMLFIDGARLVERYLHGRPSNPGLGAAAWTLADDECFALGDNRAHSADSRHYGPVRLRQIEGRLLWRVWPPIRRRRA